MTRFYSHMKVIVLSIWDTLSDENDAIVVDVRIFILLPLGALTNGRWEVPTSPTGGDGCLDVEAWEEMEVETEACNLCGGLLRR